MSRAGDLLARARALEADWIGLRRALHREPETGFQEHGTSARLRAAAMQAGLVPSAPVVETGFWIDAGPAGAPLVAWRADIDGLPIEDLKDVPYRSVRPGFGHLCGHDVHSTVAVAVATLVAPYADRLGKRIRVFFQPAEETSPSGAPEIWNAGVLADAECVLGLHCDPTLPTGTYALRAGPDTASFDGFEITVSGGDVLHSARPHTGVDTLWVALKLAQELYALPTRITDARVPCVVALGTFHGGEAINAIPGTVRFSGTIRTSGETERNAIEAHVDRLVKGYAEMYRCQIERVRHQGSPPVVNDADLTARVTRKLQAVLGTAAVVERDQSMGAEDFGHYTAHIPGVFLRCGTRKDAQTGYALHSNRFDVDEAAIAPTAALMAELLLSLAEGSA